MLVNGINEREQLTSVYPRIEDQNKGTIYSEAMFAGQIANPMDLRGFPFDEDSMDFRICGLRLSSNETTTAQDYRLWAKDGAQFVEFQFDSHLPEYEILGVSYVEYTRMNQSYITLGISIRRKHWYYFFSRSSIFS